MPPVDSESYADRFRRRVLDVLPRLLCFDAADYLKFHGDLASADLHDHFAIHGIWEGRRAIAPERLTARLARAAALMAADAPQAGALQRAYLDAATLAPAIHLPENPTYAETQLAERVAASLRGAGGGGDFPVEITTAAPAEGERGAVLISPQRIFGAAPVERHLQICAASVMVAVGDPYDPAFGEQLPYLLSCGGIVALEAETYVLFRAAGAAPVMWLGGVRDAVSASERPARHPLFDGLGRAIQGAAADLPWTERPIDVLALDPVSPMRTNAWARMAREMMRFKTIVYSPQANVVPDADEAALRRYLYARSKIVLHLNEDASGALSSRMIEEAAAAGAVILSEPCRPHLLLKAGRHYVESSARRMPQVIQDLTGAQGGAERAQAAIEATRRALAAAFDPETQALALVNLLLDARDGGE